MKSHIFTDINIASLVDRLECVADQLIKYEHDIISVTTMAVGQQFTGIIFYKRKS